MHQSQPSASQGMLDWQDLHHLVVLGRRGTIAAAARDLRVDHATVSRRVASLEKSIGLKLVVRSAKSCRLTQEGEELVAMASQMDAAATGIQLYVRGAVAPLSGTVAISALPIVASMIVAPSLPALLARYRQLRVVLNATSRVASLPKGEADIAIGFVRPEASTSIVRRLGALKLGLYANEAMLRRPQNEWAFIGFENTLEHIPQHAWLARFAGQRLFALRCNDVASQHAAARSGVGLAVLPTLIADRDSMLVQVNAVDGPSARDLWLSVHADLRRSPAVRATMDHLIDVFQGLG